MKGADRLRDLIDASRQMVVFTGAGISTESGIPDFRSPGGIWSRYKPIGFDEFMESAAKRRDYWRLKFLVDRDIREAKPNAGHLAVAKLVQSGKVWHVITQNVDGLHQASGIPEEQVIELHGNTTYAACLECGQPFELDPPRGLRARREPADLEDCRLVPMIDIDGLTRRYGDTAVVDTVTLQVRQGELLALVGGSGAGKSTLLKMINRLIEPTAGCVRLDGEDTRSVEPHTLRRRIGYVFQGVGLFPHWTVAENVAVPLTLEGWPARRIRQRVDEVLELVELPADVRERRPEELSGGQQQRVGVARALAASPRVLLLDEPFGALDPVTRDRLQQSLLDLKQRLGLTAILVTHDMTEALLLADRLGVMREGRLVQVGSPPDLLRAPADAGVAALFDTPRRQVRVLDTRLGGLA